jgi:hypothetical protein
MDKIRRISNHGAIYSQPLMTRSSCGTRLLCDAAWEQLYHNLSCPGHLLAAAGWFNEWRNFDSLWEFWALNVNFVRVKNYLCFVAINCRRRLGIALICKVWLILRPLSSFSRFVWQFFQFVDSLVEEIKIWKCLTCEKNSTMCDK